MGRPVIREETIDMELALEIRREFPNLTEFYQTTGLTMPRADFYAILRGEPHTAENVQAVELALSKAYGVSELTDTQVTGLVAKTLKRHGADVMTDSIVAKHLRIVAGRLHNRGGAK